MSEKLAGIAASEIDQFTASEQDPWTLYLYAMKSPVTREKYQRRLGQFFDFLGLSGESTQDKSIIFCNKAREDTNWAFSCIIRFLQFQNTRVNQKLITGATVRSYVKSIKLF